MKFALGKNPLYTDLKIINLNTVECKSKDYFACSLAFRQRPYKWIVTPIPSFWIPHDKHFMLLNQTRCYLKTWLFERVTNEGMSLNQYSLFQVAFIHIDRQMILTIHNHVITRIPRFSITHDKHFTWSLKIQNVQKEDKGFYMCQVNTDPMVSKVGYLDVVGTYICYTYRYFIKKRTAA